MPKFSKGQYLSAFVAAAALLAGTQTAHAAGFQLKEQSAEGQGNSYAGSTAKAYDASTIFFNPAGMARIKGNKFQFNGAVISPTASFQHESSSRQAGTLFNGTKDEGGVNALVPSMYGIYELNDQVKLGLSINTPFGLSTNYDDDWVGAQYNLKSSIETITATPSASFEFAPGASVGAGIQVQYLNGLLTRKASPQVGGDVELAADDVGYGFVLGGLYEYSDKGRIGVNWRSRVKHTLDGHVKVSGALLASANKYYQAQADLTTPDVVSVGWYHDIDDKWSVMSDIAWTNWSVFDELRVQDKSGVNADSVTTYKWSDTMFYSLGVNYQYDEQVKLQTGIAYDTGAANDEHRTAGIPDSDRYWLSVGVEYKLNDTVKWNLGYSHLWGDDAKVNESSKATGAGSSYSGTFETGVNILTAGFEISF